MKTLRVPVSLPLIPAARAAATRIARSILPVLILLGCAAAARADVVSPYTPGVQRFFPQTPIYILNTKGIVTGTTPLVFNANYKVGFKGYVLITALGGAASSPSISLYTGTGAAGKNTSADPSQLYVLLTTSSSAGQLYANWSDATNTVNPINFTTASTHGSPITIYLADSNWCWDACSQMLLGAAGITQTQDAIADDAFVAPLAGHFYNQPNHLNSDVIQLSGSMSRKGLGRVIDDLGSIKSQVTGQLTADKIKAQVDSNFPMVFQIGWYPTANTRDGGHVITCYGIGIDNDTLSIADPWPSSAGAGHQVFSLAALTNTGYPPTGKWEATLVGAPLDLLILCDTTASMTDALDSVEASITAIIGNVIANFPDYRIALADFRDNPDWSGDPIDYIYQADVPFTTDTNAFSAGVAALSLGDGGDIPEADYSALIDAMAGSGIGAWRIGNTQRVIILITDAPAHDPEPWSGGTDSAAVIATATNAALPIHICPMIVDDSDASEYGDAVAMGGLLAAATGGLTVDGSATDVGGAIINTLLVTATNARTPQGNVAAIYPTFTLTNNDPSGMENPPQKITIQLQKQKGKNSWVTFHSLSVSGSTTMAQFPGPVPVGNYRWRLALSYGASIITSPDGLPLEAVPAHTSAELNYTYFTRLLALPGAPTPISPNTLGFTATNSSVTYEWTAGTGATAYAMKIFLSNGKVFRNLMVTVPKDLFSATTLEITIPGHIAGDTYSWEIQSLNYDHPKATPSNWVQNLVHRQWQGNHIASGAPVRQTPSPVYTSHPAQAAITKSNDLLTPDWLLAAARPEVVARAQYSQLHTSADKLEYLGRLASAPVSARLLPFLRGIVSSDPSVEARARALGVASTIDATQNEIVPVLDAALSSTQPADLRLQALEAAQALAPSLLPGFTTDRDEQIGTTAQYLIDTMEPQ